MTRPIEVGKEKRKTVSIIIICNPSLIVRRFWYRFRTIGARDAYNNLYHRRSKDVLSNTYFRVSTRLY